MKASERMQTNPTIPPKYGGLIEVPNYNDVLSGRGGKINAHPGNLQFRRVVNQYKGIYIASETKKIEKPLIAAQIVNIIRNMNPPGRFLEQVEDNECWVEIGDEKACKKAGQAVREHQKGKNKSKQQSYQSSTYNTQTLLLPYQSVASLPQSLISTNNQHPPNDQSSMLLHNASLSQGNGKDSMGTTTNNHISHNGRLNSRRSFFSKYLRHEESSVSLSTPILNINNNAYNKMTVNVSELMKEDLGSMDMLSMEMQSIDFNESSSISDVMISTSSFNEILKEENTTFIIDTAYKDVLETPANAVSTIKNFSSGQSDKSSYYNTRQKCSSSSEYSSSR